MTALYFKKQLGSYTEYFPPQGLDTFFSGFWTVEGQKSTKSHRVLPDLDPCLALRVVGDEISDVLIYGPHSGTKMFTPKKSETFVAAKFRAEWLSPILGFQPHEVHNFIGPLSDFNKTLAARFQKTLIGSNKPAEVLRRLVCALEMLCEEVGATRRNAGLAQRAGDLFRVAPGARTAAIIAGDLDVSPRHLLRVFRAEIGFGPNHFKRNLRFLEALYLGDQATRPDLAGIASDARYFDQSHMIRDFKALCGLTPKEVFSERKRLSVLSRAEQYLPEPLA